MNKIIQCLTALLFAGTALTSSAAPRAAEDPSAVVISTTASAPRVKRETLAEKPRAAPAKQNKSPRSKVGVKKKSGKQAVARGKNAKHSKKAR